MMGTTRSNAIIERAFFGDVTLHTTVHRFFGDGTQFCGRRALRAWHANGHADNGNGHADNGNRSSEFTFRAL
jgi:hypothetical protein